MATLLKQGYRGDLQSMGAGKKGKAREGRNVRETKEGGRKAIRKEVQAGVSPLRGE